jgi:hypothetical protein
MTILRGCGREIIEMTKYILRHMDVDLRIQFGHRYFFFLRQLHAWRNGTINKESLNILFSHYDKSSVKLKVMDIKLLLILS